MLPAMLETLEAAKDKFALDEDITFASTSFASAPGIMALIKKLLLAARSSNPEVVVLHETLNNCVPVLLNDCVNV
jgi:hypothetical protein